MAKKIKVSRKKIKQKDEFITFTDQVIDWFNKNRNLAYGIIGGAVLALALLSFVNYMVRSRRAQADRLLVEAFSILNTPLASELTQASILQGAKNYSTQEERADEAIKKLSEVIKRFGRSGAGLEARFHLGEVYLSKRDYAKSLEAYQEFLKHLGAGSSSAAILEVPAYLGMAKAYYSSGDLKNAQIYFQKVLDSKQDAYLAEATLGLARVLINTGKNDEAKEKLEMLSKNYPGSIYDQLAKIEMSKLSSGEKSEK